MGTAHKDGGAREWGPTGRLRGVKCRWWAQQKSVAQPCPLLASYLTFLNLLPRDKTGTVRPHQVVRSKLTVKSFLKRAVLANGRGLIATKVLTMKRALRVNPGTPEGLSAPLKAGPGQKEATVR